MINDYVILVSPSEPRGYLGLESDEDDGEPSAMPPRTTDNELAVRFDNAADADAWALAAAARYPRHSFCVDVLPRPSRSSEESA